MTLTHEQASEKIEITRGELRATIDQLCDSIVAERARAQALDDQCAALFESNCEFADANDTLRAERDAALGVVRDAKRAYQSMQSEIEDLRAERDMLNRRVESLQATLTTVNNDNDELRAKLEQAQREIKYLSSTDHAADIAMEEEFDV